MAAKKPQRVQKEATASTSQANRANNESSQTQNTSTTDQVKSKKKKSGKVITLAEAASGSIVFQKGKPCVCQARRHMLISNCLSCGKIVCEQEGEGPCNFCGALVLKEGSAYAGLDDGGVVVTDAEAIAEAYAKRLVDYDRNSAARTTVIDDQSDYYEMDNNTWLSKEEKEILRKKKEELDEAERAKRNKVVMTFDILGRKVITATKVEILELSKIVVFAPIKRGYLRTILMGELNILQVLLNEDEASEEMQNRILLRPPEETRIKPNPNLKIQPTFIDPGPRQYSKGKNFKKALNKGMCLEISGRVQHGSNEVEIM